VALKSDAAAEKPKDQLSRDFLGCSIFDFCNNIRQKRTLAAAEDGLYVIALWIEHEARVVTSQVTFSGIAKPGGPILVPLALGQAE